MLSDPAMTRFTLVVILATVRTVLAGPAAPAATESTSEHWVSMTVDPAPIVIGYLEGEVAVRVASRVALAVSGARWHLPGNTSYGNQLAISAPFYQDAALEGGFIEPGFLTRISGSYDDFECTNMGTACGGPGTRFYGAQVLMGISHVWSPGIRAAIAIGPAIAIAGDPGVAGNLAINGYFHLGIAL
jgi:hypothetical protein